MGPMRPRTNLRSAPVGGGRHGPPLTRLHSGAALQGAKPTTTRGVAIRLCPQGRDVEGHVPGTEEDMQQLMTVEIAKTVPGLYGQDGAEDPTVYAHYFSCVNGWDWWLLEFDGTDEAFGLVEGYDDELGYFSIKEMAELNRQMGFAAVERDEHFSPKPLSAVRRR
ncbi:DUF2958 domain-containing protein [Collinsella sp. AF11-11]|nr:DUF2958 domain-containing protein [Collinsella sp. AF11-11]